MRLRQYRRDRGFTLLELLIALIVAAVLFGIAFPSYLGLVARVHATAARGAISMTLFDALRESTVHGSEAVVCPSIDAEQCSDGIDWSRGWIAFIDLNADRSHNAGEPVFRTQRALSRDVRLHSTVGRPRIVYQSNGSNAGSNVTFTLCDRRGPQAAISLILANSGRLRTEQAPSQAAAACTAEL